MPTKTRVHEFIGAVVHGDHVEAIRNFYHEDASMQENLDPPRVGRDALVAHEGAGQTKIKSVYTHKPETVLIDGDNVAIAWVFDIVDLKGVPRRLSEVAMQRWRGDRIAEERFVYDSARAWEKIGS